MANFGEALKREREQRDIPLRDIANATKINLRYLEALEQNRFDKLPGGVFNKGFIRAYARFIGADGEALVQRYMEEMAEKEAATEGGQPRPDRPGVLRPPQAPPRRRGAAEGAAEPAAGAGPAITLGEGRAATARPARADMLPASANVPFRPAGETFPQARLLLAGTTVVAAFAALGTVFYLVRTARHESGLEAPSHETAPAGIPASPDPGPAEETTPVSPAPQDDADEGEAPPPGASPGAAPDGAGSGSTPPARPLPELPRDRNGSTSPVRVASPIPAPAQEQTTQGTGTRKPVKPAVVPPAPSPAPAATAPPSGSANPNPGSGTAGAAPPGPPALSGPMSLVVTAVTPVTVLVGCDGAEKPARTMLAGETIALRCYSLVRISAEDAGAVRLTLDGAPCPSLGASGGRVEHFTIRAEDARAICPPGGGTGAHGRR
jgi:cytoskeletal protein RodZ